jgi:hypothetical protein
MIVDRMCKKDPFQWTCVCGKAFRTAKARYFHYLRCDVANEYVYALVLRDAGEEITSEQKVLIFRGEQEKLAQAWRKSQGIKDLTEDEMHKMQQQCTKGIPLRYKNKGHPDGRVANSDPRSEKMRVK